MFEKELQELKKRYLLRSPIVVESAQGPRITVNGKQVILMSSNDYLGLAGHPSLSTAACAAMERYGFGAGASRLMSGTSALHEELEDRIAAFKGTESALLYNSGYAANTGIIPAVADDGDVILSDRLNHASIIDGCRLSRAKVCVYRHKDVHHAEDILKRNTHARRKLIVTDGVFSMDGDIAPLSDLADLAEKYHAILMVDDAHATGVLGPKGRGTAEHCGMTGRVPIQMGTLGKALGSFGAYVAGTRDVINYLINTSRSLLYSTALPPAICAASIAAIDIVEAEPERRERLWRNRERFTQGLRALGLGMAESETPIIPIIVGESGAALDVGTRLFEQGLFAPAIRPPTVPEGSARIRTTVMATHTDEDIDGALEIIERVKRKGSFSHASGRT